MDELAVTWLYRFKHKALPGQGEWHGVVKIGPAPFRVELSGQGDQVALRSYSPCCCQLLEARLYSGPGLTPVLGCADCGQDYHFPSSAALRLVEGEVRGTVGLPLVLDHWSCPPLKAALLTAETIERLAAVGKPASMRGLRATDDHNLSLRVCRVAAAEMVGML